MVNIKGKVMSQSWSQSLYVNEPLHMIKLLKTSLGQVLSKLFPSQGSHSTRKSGENDRSFSSHGNMKILNFEKYHGKNWEDSWKMFSKYDNTCPN